MNDKKITILLEVMRELHYSEDMRDREIVRDELLKELGLKNN